MYVDVDNTQDTINTSDIDQRISELEDDKSMMEAGEDVEFGEDEQNELDSLIEFRDELKDYIPDWEYGETLINEDYFEEYIEEMIRDCYEGDFDSFPYNCIDWEKVAEEAKVDYTSGELDGVTFYGRS